jgi:DNA-binding CsgD family transcriptional regulator/tetratricopeptide (TPR) repeat protein
MDVARERSFAVGCATGVWVSSGRWRWWPGWVGLTGRLGAWWGGCMRGSGAFVGRMGELSRLAGALGGDARMVLVTGDAGVGKTRFVGEGMARAAAAGMVMLQGECLPLAGRLPLLPVASALGELARRESALVEAALDAAPPFVRGEVGRLVPQMDADGGEAAEAGRDGGWRQERLFAGVADLLGVVAGRSAVGLVVEDVHWADSATLDLLTFLAWGGHRGAVTVVATCRSDEAPVAAQVSEWLAHVRGAAGVEEIRLGALSRADSAEQVAALAGGPVLPGVADELYARAEGNPFFTEQLVADALAEAPGGDLRVPADLPARLAELLRARAGRCAADARAVLAGLAVAARPLAEDQLAAVTGLSVDRVHRGLRELAAARLLAEDTAGGAQRPRHVLLAVAVAGGLLPGERVVLHERTARALQAVGGDTLAAEAAGHWQAAGRPVEELPARMRAADAAERVFGYAEAAAHWQRAIELSQTQAEATGATGSDLPRLYLRAIDALHLSGDRGRAGLLAEEAYRRFAAHPDPAIAGVVCHRAASFRAVDRPAAGLPLIEEALRLLEQAGPSADQAEAWLDYGRDFLFRAQGRPGDSVTALNRALEIAEAAGATTLIPHVLSCLACIALLRGEVENALAFLQRGWALARALGDGPASVSLAVMELAVMESDALIKLARHQDAVEVAMRGLGTARQAGLAASWDAAILASNAAEPLLAQGRTAEAAALIDPLTSGPPDRDHWVVHQARTEIDLLRGDIEAAAARQQQIMECVPLIGSLDASRERAQRAAELALWAGQPAEALTEVRRVLPSFKDPEPTIFCGRLLAAGMRASADLAERARARRDEPAAMAAVTAADDLASWTGQVTASPFTDHPYVASIPAERATWDAERTRVAGESDPATWGRAAQAWQNLGCPHRAGYALWRQAEAQLNSGQPPPEAAPSLRAAAAAADGHAPLLAQVRTLAERARIPLQDPAAPADIAPATPHRAPSGLTGRELAVLRLVAAGHSNAQIGAELYMSPRTAGVHVSNILRKLGVTGRVQAAAVAERAGLLDSQQP